MKKSFEGLSTIIASLEGMQEEQDRIIKRMAQRLAQIFLREVTRRTPVGIGSFEPQEKGRGTYYKFEKRKDSATGKSRWEPIRSTKKLAAKSYSELHRAAHYAVPGLYVVSVKLMAFGRQRYLIRWNTLHTLKRTPTAAGAFCAGAW